MKDAGQAIQAFHRVRFGAFEVDLRSGELRKHGIKIKLQEKPFQILALLVEQPGEVVTREELQPFSPRTQSVVEALRQPMRRARASKSA